MKHKIFCNKKALSEFMLDIWSYIIFATMVFLFLLVIEVLPKQRTQNELRSIASFPSSSISLNNYLRTPVEINGNLVNFADLIALWKLDPDKYRPILESQSGEILNKLEYEYDEPQTKNRVIRGFDVIINKEKKFENAIEPILEFKSKSFQDGTCITNQNGCLNLGEAFIPTMDGQVLYIVMRESYKSKK